MLSRTIVAVAVLASSSGAPQDPAGRTQRVTIAAAGPEARQDRAPISVDSGIGVSPSV